MVSIFYINCITSTFFMAIRTRRWWQTVQSTKWDNWNVICSVNRLSKSICLIRMTTNYGIHACPFVHCCANGCCVAAPSHLCSSFSKKKAVHKNNRFQRLTLMAIATSNKKTLLLTILRSHFEYIELKHAKIRRNKKTCLVFLSIVCARPQIQRRRKKKYFLVKKQRFIRYRDDKNSRKTSK